MKAMIAVAGWPVAKGGVKYWPHTSAVAMPGTYIDALQAAGGREAVLMPGSIDRDEAHWILERFDGLLLMGGGDVAPSLFGQEPLPEVYGVSADRDAFEAELVRVAVECKIPTLAICRGAQIMNVALGGTLDQHIEPRAGVEHGFSDTWASHPVNLKAGSLVASIMANERVECPSHHHQALDRLGQGLTAVGWADDGILEAVEMDGSWVVGVQWHPELTALADPAQQSLFVELVEQAELFRSKRQD